MPRVKTWIGLDCCLADIGWFSIYSWTDKLFTRYTTCMKRSQGSSARVSFGKVTRHGERRRAAPSRSNAGENDFTVRRECDRRRFGAAAEGRHDAPSFSEGRIEGASGEEPRNAKETHSRVPRCLSGDEHSAIDRDCNVARDVADRRAERKRLALEMRIARLVSQEARDDRLFLVRLALRRPLQ